MIGAIIGDTIGSIYEFNNIKTKDFDFWGEGIEPTDDSVLTFATANWLLHGGEAWRHYCDFATEYDNPMGEYGSGFLQFVANARRGGKPQPYNSCGNGSAMRVGPVGWAFNTMDEVLERARVSAECSHNHPEGIKGAQATAASILLARKGADKAAIETAIKTMPNYFADYDTTVEFISMEQMRRDHSGLPHGGSVIRSGVTGWDGENHQTIEYKLTLDSNPQFTASVLTACARAAMKMRARGETGCRTIFDIAPADLSPVSREDMLAHLL